ncbi:hypothetical protein RI129_000150 [Pyrocoelia pectoralis]|uniref:Tyr recombinase domain-containing protein n=1 Tax=Pyrocoelia pectoralis TaxID=417401 RepID=A0AAN7ZBP7_9COLE
MANENSDEECINGTPPELQCVTNESALELLPQKSRTLYEKQYSKFKKWRIEKNAKNITENVLLAYLSSMSNHLKSSTLWSTYSMLKSTLAVKDNIDISKFRKLRTFLKKQNVGYKAKKSKIFSRDQLNRFLRDAPNHAYLMWKVCLLIGIAGACGRDELRQISIEDIADKDDLLVITIPDSKNWKKRIFTLTPEITEGINSLELFRKYAALRPAHCEHKAFFINYRLGKCSTQVVGVHTFAKIPSLIAQYLALPNPSAYTGHCYRRTSASLLADSGARIPTFKRHGRCKSTTVAEGYVEDSIRNKINMSRSILTGTSFVSVQSALDKSSLPELQGSSSNESSVETQVAGDTGTIKVSTSMGNTTIHFHNCSHFTIHVHKY